MDGESRIGPALCETPDLSVVVPAYNEEASIRPTLTAIREVLAQHGTRAELLVVDDGSTDATVTEAQRLGVEVVRHGLRLGYGAALKTGIRRARTGRILIVDADASYPAECIPDLLEAFDDAEMVIGARTGGRDTLLKRPARWLLRRLVEYLVGVEVPDLNSGFRCFQKSTAECYLHLLPNGFSFTTTLTIACHSDARLVRYVKVPFGERIGRSKIRPLRDSLTFLLLVLRTVMYFDPLRVLMPLILGCAGVTVVRLLYELLWLRNLAEGSLTWLMLTAMLGTLALLGDLIVRRHP